MQTRTQKTIIQIFVIVVGLCLFIGIFTPISHAGEILVYPGYSIYTAMQNANYGDIVKISAGIYLDVWFTEKSGVTLQGGWNEDFSDWNPSIYETTLEIRNGGISFLNIQDAVIDGLTLKPYKYYIWDEKEIAHGIHLQDYSSVTIRNCNLYEFKSTGRGGPISCYNSILSIENTIISDNYCYASGSAVYGYFSDVTITNCIISNNHTEGSNIVDNSGSEIDLINCTIVHNTSDGYGDNEIGAGLIVNCIIWDNPLFEVNGEPIVLNSLIQGGYAGAIDEDPCFVDQENGNYYLQPESPCIDAGLNPGEDEDIQIPQEDIDRVQRPVGDYCDIGAYEYDPDLPPGSDTSPPSIPTNLAVTELASTQITISWDPSVDNVGVVGYNIYRNFATSPTYTSSTNSYTDINVSEGSSYNYMVTAYDAAGNESGLSENLPVTLDVTPPSVPADLQVTQISETQISLAWSASTDNVSVGGYNLFKDGLQIYTGPSTNFTDTEVTAGETHTYTVAAFDSVGNNSAESGPLLVAVPGPDTTPPSIPTNLVVTELASTHIAISWDPSTDNVGVVGYNIYRNCAPSPTYTSSTNSYTDINVSEPAFYSYRVTAYDAAGNESGQSEYLPVALDVTPPSVPADLQVTQISETQVCLAWSASTDNTYVNGYNLFKDGLQVYTGPSTNFTDTEVTAGETYTYTVAAFDSVGNNSAQSEPLSVTVPEPDTSPPSIPTNLAVVEVTSTQISISWDPSTDNVGVTGYKIYRGGVMVDIGSTSNYTDNDISPGFTYSYTVSAFDAAGNESVQSAALIITAEEEETEVIYPDSKGNNTNYEWIEQIKVGYYTNASGKDFGYGDYTADIIDLTQGSSISVSLTPGYTYPYTEYWRIWIDFNHDGDFTDSGEIVFSGYSNAQINGSISIPSTVSSGTTRMRITMKYGGYPLSYGSFTYGEVEDYTVNIVESVVEDDLSSPTVPTNLVKVEASSTKVSIAWSPSADNIGVAGYNIFKNGVFLNNTTSTNYTDYGTFLEGSAYGYAVSAYDAAGNESGKTEIIWVIIPEGTTVIVYPASQGNYTSYEWIQKIMVGTYSNNSGNNGGYADYTSETINLTKGMSYSVQLTPGYMNYAYSEFWKIWIDFNQDGDFTDSGEDVFSGYSNSLVSGFISIPASAFHGNTRMRITMKYGGYPLSYGSFTYGEVEDYMVNITP